MIPLSCPDAATLACLVDVLAPKPGNVHRGADFEDLTLGDMATSAVLIGSSLRPSTQRRVGTLIRDAAESIAKTVGRNTYLGTILLLGPLAKSTLDGDSAGKAQSAVAEVLRGLRPEDAEDVFESIRIAQPGGLGRMEEFDIRGPAPTSLLEAMRSAADRDLVARQYVTNYAVVFQEALPLILQGQQQGWLLSQSVVHTHVSLMARYPDSLIARKNGIALAEESQARAAFALQKGPPGSTAYEQGLGELDVWLRSDGNRRNPGTTADLVAAAVFVLLRCGFWSGPIR